MIQPGYISKCYVRWKKPHLTMTYYIISFLWKVHKKQLYRQRKTISCLGVKVGMEND